MLQPHFVYANPEFAIRPVRPGDGPLLVALMEGLSADTLYRRYLMHTPVNHAEIEFVCHLGADQGAAFLAATYTHRERAIGLAYYVRSRPDATLAEPAIVVTDDWQGMGIGRRLAHSLSRHAHRSGVNVFEATMLPTNRAAFSLVSHSGVPYEASEAYGERVTRVFLDRADLDRLQEGLPLFIAPQRLSPFS